MNRCFFLAMSLICFTLVSPVAEAQTAQVLQFLGRHTQRPATFDKGSAEVVTYDPASKTAIISDANGNKISFINVTNPANPVLIRDVLLTAYSGIVNGVAVKNGLVAVALEDATLKSNPGKVLFFDLANLDQLYRVGSFIILAVVLLLVAYLYHRQAAGTRDEVSTPP